MAKQGKHNGIYSSSGKACDDLMNQLNELFPVSLPRDAAHKAGEALAKLAEAEQRKELGKHRLSGETIDAVEVSDYYRGLQSPQIKFLFGIPREGNVRNERPKKTQTRKGRGNWKNRTVKDSYGYLGDGAFYKGIYLEYGHGSFAPTHWLEKGVNKARRAMDDEFMKALLAEWLK